MIAAVEIFFAIAFAWILPVVIVGILKAIYEPLVKLKRSGTAKMINRCVLVFYKFRFRSTMHRKDKCPLCKKVGMRCRVKINPITGMHTHVSLNAMRSMRARGYSSSTFGTRRTPVSS